MNSFRSGINRKLSRITLYIFAAAGIVAAVAGTLTNLPWISENITSILLFELSALLGYLVMTLGSVSDGLEDIRVRSTDFHTFDTPDSLYRAAATALRDVLDSPNSNKSVLAVSVTGVPNIRPPLPNNPAARDYYKALADVANRTGWSIRILYHVESIERLEWVRKYLIGMHDAADLEARAVVHTTQEILAPLIIGDSHVFLAQGDRRFHAVRAGIWLKEISANVFARNYFDSLWQAASLRVLRRATGLDETTFEDIRSELSAQTSGQS
jgi:hypothetical protein